MRQKIEYRITKRQEHLEALKSARETMNVLDRSYSHIDGRIREVEDELDWLNILLTDFPNR